MGGGEGWKYGEADEGKDYQEVFFRGLPSLSTTGTCSMQTRPSVLVEARRWHASRWRCGKREE